MRIAIVTPEFPPNTIGGGGVVVEAVTSLLALNHTVRVFSADHSGPSWVSAREVTEHMGYQVCRYPSMPFFMGVDYLRSVLPPNPHAIKDLFRDITSWNPDVAHVHGCGYAISDISAWALRRAHIPYLLTDHGLPLTPERKNAVIRILYRTYESVVMSATVRGADEASAVSEAEADLFELRLGRRPIVIGNGISPSPHPGEAGLSGILCEFISCVSRMPVVLAAGRITRTKGFDILIDAVSEIDGPDFRCYIVGEALDRSYLEKLKQNSNSRVTFTGPILRDELMAMMARATVVAVPSLHEPFGMVAIEAMSAGARVVASEVGGLRDFVQSPYGKLVPPNDVKALAAAIKDALLKGRLTQDELRAVNGELETRSWTVIAKRYDTVLKSIARTIG